MTHRDPTITLGQAQNGAFCFQRPRAGQIQNAMLKLTCIPPQYGGQATLKVFRLKPPIPDRRPEPGIAQNYVQDAGLADHPAVRYFADCSGELSDGHLQEPRGFGRFVIR